ncbi:MAG: 2-hydroxyacid dehydrogenase [Gammaproteobacteria bacterium]|nr:2-hydroxyacid dehydrogenase [Gammaproteobacteria bacterium]
MSDTGIQSAAFLDLDSVDRDDLDLSRLTASISQWEWHGLASHDDLHDILANTDVVITNKVVLTDEHLGSAERLKLVCIAATGTNNVDIEAAARNNITVCNVSGYATTAVVQHVFMLLLVLTTRFNEYTAAIRRGDWSRSPFFCLLDYPLRELAGKSIGIVGYGNLGRAVAKVAEAFGMHVLLARRDTEDTRPDRLALHELLPQVDVLTLHCPLTEHNRGMIGAAELALMKHDAVLINTARGGLVDEYALVEALKSKQIGGAGLDVLETEPPPPGYPILKTELPNLVITPHTAWASLESRQRLVDEIALNIEAFRAGQPRNVV